MSEGRKQPFSRTPQAEVKVVEKQDPKCFGATEMRELLDKYSDEELGFLLGNLDSIQTNLGCSPQCDFCALKTRKGPVSFFDVSAIRELLDRNIQGKKAADILNGNGVRLYFGDEPFDNPDLGKIVKEIAGRGILVGGFSTAYPDIPGIAEKIDEVMKDGGYLIDNFVRFSVTDDNLGRLIKDGWLVESAGVIVKGERCRNKRYVVNFSPRLVEKNISIDSAVWEGEPQEERKNVGRAGKNADQNKDFIYLSLSETVLAPNGFFNFFSFLGTGNYYQEYTGSNNMPGIMRYLKKNFSDSDFYKTLIGGGFLSGDFDIKIQDLLSVGVVGKSLPHRYKKIIDGKKVDVSYFELKLPKTSENKSGDGDFVLDVYFSFDQLKGVKIEKIIKKYDGGILFENK